MFAAKDPPMATSHPFNTLSSSPPAPPLHGTLLYIEDDPINVLTVEGLLDHHPGVRLVHTPSGHEGVRLARSENPDFVLLDMHLPDISGLEVVRQLNEHIADHGLRVTILTGDTLTVDIIKAISLGAFEYWFKPLDGRVFEDGLRRALTGKRPHPRHTISRQRPGMWV